MKKVLVVSYYWPPAGGISVLRSLKIVKYLREFGWEPVVYTPSNAHYPYLDHDNQKDVPSGVTILKQPIIEPFKLFKRLTGRKKKDNLNSIVTIQDSKSSWLDNIAIWIRGNFFIPDARSLWIKPSVKYILGYLDKNPVDAIFTDGPPHTNTYIGYLISKKTGIPWLADFQDPWTQVDYYPLLKLSKWADLKHQKMEQECFRQANRITIASPSWKEDLESIGANNVDVIYYGYDEADFQLLVPTSKNKKFTICHIGLLGVDRDISEVFQRLDYTSYSKKIVLRLAGQVDRSVLKKLQQIDGLEIQHLGIIQRSDALQTAVNADLLLLPLNKAHNSRGRLPGKLYEYLRTYNPILALGSEDSDAAKILEETKAGLCINYQNKEKINDFLVSILHDGVQKAADPSKIESFSNRNQIRKIGKILDSIL